MDRKEFLEKMKILDKRLIVTVVKLHSGALETLVNNSELEAKADYLINAYDDNMRLKTMQDIILLDCIVIEGKVI